jgi:CheY-like chemotaxis protein
MTTKILVVDDIHSHIRLAQSLLEPFGYKVFTASSLDQAMNVLDNESPLDLILSDIGMPGSSGFDLIQQVKEKNQYKDTPFVFITSTYWAEDERQKAYALGATRFIFRPLEAKAILTEIEAALPEEKRLSKKNRPGRGH